MLGAPVKETSSKWSFAGRTLDELLADAEVAAVESALEQAEGNKSRAARDLGLKLGALRYRMQKLGMDSTTLVKSWWMHVCHIAQVPPL